MAEGEPTPGSLDPGRLDERLLQEAQERQHYYRGYIVPRYTQKKIESLLFKTVKKRVKNKRDQEP